MRNLIYLTLNLIMLPIRMIVILLKIILGDFKANKVKKIPEYLYYVVPSKDIEKIKKCKYIILNSNTSDIFTGLNDKFIFYCYGKKPEKVQYEKSKGNICEQMSLIIIKYDKFNMKEIYTRRHDDCLMLPMNDDKLSLKNFDYRIEHLNW